MSRRQKFGTKFYFFVLSIAIIGIPFYIYSKLCSLNILKESPAEPDANYILSKKKTWNIGHDESNNVKIIKSNEHTEKIPVLNSSYHDISANNLKEREDRTPFSFFPVIYL